MDQHDIDKLQEAENHLDALLAFAKSEEDPRPSNRKQKKNSWQKSKNFRK